MVVTAVPRIVEERPQRGSVSEIAMRGETLRTAGAAQAIGGSMQAPRSPVCRRVVRRRRAAAGIGCYAVPGNAVRTMRGERTSVGRGVRTSRPVQGAADVADVHPRVDVSDAGAVPAHTDMRREVATATEMRSSKMLNAADVRGCADVRGDDNVRGRIDVRRCAELWRADMRRRDVRGSAAPAAEMRYTTTTTAAAEMRGTAAAAADMRGTTAAACRTAAVAALGRGRTAGQESGESGCTK